MERHGLETRALAIRTRKAGCESGVKTGSQLFSLVWTNTSPSSPDQRVRHQVRIQCAQPPTQKGQSHVTINYSFPTLLVQTYPSPQNYKTLLLFIQPKPKTKTKLKDPKIQKCAGSKTSTPANAAARSNPPSRRTTCAHVCVRGSCGPLACAGAARAVRWAERSRRGGGGGGTATTAVLVVVPDRACAGRLQCRGRERMLAGEVKVQVQVQARLQRT